MIRSATVADAQHLLTIYNYYVVNTPITFEEEPVASADMAGRMEQVLRSLPWLLWEEDGTIQGFVYASAWKGRSAYRHSVESPYIFTRNISAKGSALVCTKLFWPTCAKGRSTL